MICGLCKTREARIFYTEIVNGKKKEQYLCEECAAKSTNFKLKTPFGGQEFSLGALLSGLFEGEQHETEEGGEDREHNGIAAGPACATCGMTYEEFKEKGQFGCAECYHSFGRLLLKNMRNIQGSDVHTGKKPKHVGEHIELPVENVPELSEMERLTMQLGQALEQEEYEAAAALRDQIRALRQAKGEVSR